ncbi:phosphatase domain-containing protein [Gordonia metallireducens]|uniref:phosphatase domain-containing protein n=1 Tax=Gordonia metallireducens TaxID=2897779 RepID=UPI001E43BD9C|nr:polynucleotide kinase [Gordonia metallireducens]
MTSLDDTSETLPAEVPADTHSSEACSSVVGPTAWLIDIDGTLALRADRSPFDWDRVGEDLPNQPAIIAAQAIAAHPAVTAIVAVSGREEICRRQTEMWLDAQCIPYDELLMRRIGDNRPDDVVKREIYQTEIAPRLRVIGVLDDRDRVVRMWRSLGLTCFQVAPGDF